MAKSSPAATLAKLVQQLQAERQDHLDAIEEIDATFDALGIKPGKAGRRRRPKNGRRKGKAAKKRASKKRAKKKGRKRFRTTGEDLVVSLLKKNKTMTTSQINKRWNQAGRGGNADNTLSKLTRDKKVKRTNIKGAMGSEYRLVK